MAAWLLSKKRKHQKQKVFYFVTSDNKYAQKNEWQFLFSVLDCNSTLLKPLKIKVRRNPLNDVVASNTKDSSDQEVLPIVDNENANHTIDLTAQATETKIVSPGRPLRVKKKINYKA